MRGKRAKTGRKGKEGSGPKHQRPTACNRMATPRTPFVFAAPGKVGANSLDNAGGTQGSGKVVYTVWSSMSVRWGAGVVAVGGGDVGVAVQAQEADGEAAQRCHHAGCVPGLGLRAPSRQAAAQPSTDRAHAALKCGGYWLRGRRATARGRPR